MRPPDEAMMACFFSSGSRGLRLLWVCSPWELGLGSYMFLFVRFSRFAFAVGLLALGLGNPAVLTKSTRYTASVCMSSSCRRRRR